MVSPSSNNLQMYASGPYKTFHSAARTRSQIKLGGPSTINQDKMNFCSRDSRDKIFTHENQKNFVGRGMPGPAEYYTNRISSLNSKH